MSTDARDLTSGPAVRIIASLPVLVPVFVGLLTVSAMTLMLLERYRGVVALVIAAVLMVGAVRIVGLGERRVTRKELVVDLLALLLAVGFAGVNAKLATQDVVISRDPGVYSVASQWLVHHQSVDVDTMTRIFGGTRGLQSQSVGIGIRPEPDHVYFQGSHGLPAVLAVAGTVFGPRIMYGANAVLGGLALLAVYGFGRILIGRWPAFAAAVLVGATLPQLAFSRDTYTEPISQLLLFGGLSLLMLAKRGRWPLWFLGGLVIAGSCVTRIDSFLVLPPVIATGALFLGFAPKGERKAAGLDTAALYVGVTIPAALGYLDLKLFSAGYLHSLRADFRRIEVLIVVALVAAVVLVVLCWSTPLVRRLTELRQVTRTRIAAVVGGGFLLLGALLAVRPLLMTAHGLDDPGKQAFLKTLQVAEKVTIDPTRTYAESTVTWLTWYLGPFLVILGLLGLAVLLVRAVRNGDLSLTPFLLLFVVTGLGYLVKPSITPDQIWAMRRFLPTVVPALALAAMLVVALVLAWLRTRPPGWSIGAGLVAAVALVSPAFHPITASRLGAIALVLILSAGVLLALRGSRRLLSAGVATLALLALAVPIARTTRPLGTTAQGVGQLAELQHVCAGLPANAAVFLLGNISRTLPMSLRAFCDVPATWVDGGIPPALSDMKVIRTALRKSGKELYLLGQGDIQRTVVSDVPFVPFNSRLYRTWVATVSHPPRDIRPIERDLYLGLVGPQGSVVRWLKP
jgi:hypothetical protein